MHEKETKFADLRQDKEMTQKEVAEKLKVFVDTYSKWERGINDIPLVKSNELANFYNVSLDFLLGLSDYSFDTERKDINLNLFCNRLSELRKKHHLTQSELSKKVGFTQTTYTCYENGTSIPTTFKVYYIALYYNVSLDYLVGRSDEKKIK